METLTGPDEAAAWVRTRKAEGSDWIKIIYEDGSAFDMEIASLDGETVGAVIEAAHAEGLAAVVHVSTLETALEAMAFGADGLVHVWRDEVVSEADARRFAEADVFVVPTLSVMVSPEDSAVAELVQETDDALLSPVQRQTLADRFSGGLAEGGDVALENVRRLRAAGVRIVAGTDAPNPGTGAGISMHGELRLLVRAGMGSAEALAADAFGVADRSRIAEGHLADLVLVRGALEEDVSRSHDIVGIWKDGYLVERGGGFAGGGLQAEVVPAPAETLVADFQDGLEARFGAWDVTTDQMSGGSSSASMTVRDGGMVVTGEIAPGVAFPRAGVIWMPGEQFMQPVDFSGREVIRFRTREDWGGVLGDANHQRGAGRAVAHRDLRCSRGVDPNGDPAGGLPNGHAGGSPGGWVCGGRAGWEFHLRASASCSTDKSRPRTSGTSLGPDGSNPVSPCRLRPFLDIRSRSGRNSPTSGCRPQRPFVFFDVDIPRTRVILWIGALAGVSKAIRHSDIYRATARFAQRATRRSEFPT